MARRSPFAAPPAGYQRSMRRSPAPRSSSKARLYFALFLAGLAILSYTCSKEYNPVTGEDIHISLTPHQEIALGLQATPQMMEQYGGLHPDQQAQALVDQVGQKLVRESVAGQTEWQYEFHLLADPRVVNAFALPGGQIFVTAALFNRFTTEGQLAGVLGHEIGHVVARHSAQRMAKEQLTQGVTGAVIVASGSSSSEMLARTVAGMVNMKYGREDELQSDELGVLFMSDAGYDPRAMIEVQQILEAEAGGGAPPEFMSTHPSAPNRIEVIEATIAEIYPNGVPAGLIP
ncbi:MAG: M48 family metalloprotease [Thermoanaerobaculia bacterium]